LLHFSKGNKSDLEHRRDVDYKLAKKFANKNGLIFMETSAKTALNIELLFRKITQELMKSKNAEDREKATKLPLLVHNLNDKEIKKRKCC
jgi:GTPase SAR1 family protein